MKTGTIPFLILIVVLFSFSGCDEYSSPVPAGKIKESKVDTNYTGLWVYAGMKGDADSTLSKLDPHFLNILAYNENCYLLQLLKKDSIKTNTLPELYEATTCVLGGKNIVSIRIISNASVSPEYLIYMYGLSNDTLWYNGFQKSKLDKQFNKTKLLKNYLLNYINDTSVLLPVKQYVRIISN